MYTVLLVILIIVCFLLLTAVLMQSAKGGGIAASFGGAGTGGENSFIGGRQAGDLLTRVSWWGGGIFLALSFVMQLMSARTTAPTSILDQPFTASPAAPKTGTPPIPLTPVNPDTSGGSANPSTPPSGK